jgi:hypothetical protein
MTRIILIIFVAILLLMQAAGSCNASSGTVGSKTVDTVTTPPSTDSLKASDTLLHKIDSTNQNK